MPPTISRLPWESPDQARRPREAPPPPQSTPRSLLAAAAHASQISTFSVVEVNCIGDPGLKVALRKPVSHHCVRVGFVVRFFDNVHFHIL